MKNINRAISLISFVFFAQALSALDCSENSSYRRANPCEPVVMGLRHAEDTPDGKKSLTDPGKNHARLYIDMFKAFVFGKSHKVGPGGKDMCICPIKRLIAIDPNTTPNPFDTLAPLAQKLKLSIETKDRATGQIYNSGFNWQAASRSSLIDPKGAYSTVISWTRQGLNHRPSDIAPAKKWGEDLNHLPLLKQLPKVFTPEPSPIQSEKGFTPSRNHLFLFAQQDPKDGKFAYFKLYTQKVSNDGKSWYQNPYLKDFPKFIKAE